MAARKAKQTTMRPRVREAPPPRRPRRVPAPPPTIGWTEYVSFPAWGIHAVKAKVDTGASISALHVDSIRELGDGRVRFEVVLHRTQRHLRATAEAPVLRRTRIKSSNGQWTERYVIAAVIRLGSLERSVELSLVSRPEMVYRMLLGRGALDGVLIDAAGQCLLGVPRRKRATELAEAAGDVSTPEDVPGEAAAAGRGAAAEPAAGSSAPRRRRPRASGEAPPRPKLRKARKARESS